MSVFDFSRKPGSILPIGPSFGRLKVGSPLSPVSLKRALPIFCKPFSFVKSANSNCPTTSMLSKPYVARMDPSDLTDISDKRVVLKVVPSEISLVKGIFIGTCPSPKSGSPSVFTRLPDLSS